MAKASERTALRTELYDCCHREMRKELGTIEQSYLSFPVIKNVVCPECSFVCKLRVYSRDQLDEKIAAHS
ncbi:MAG: hypothetical protein P8K76_04200 [Candidatus Binatia bacterium]|nr:hypothetical protein [Candidatus Binatia bacterium]MDG1958735.1 hypothetical protein [Candidatus Binatia bacterium]MDG2008957.1 hypothetical protein [Candidatus Binatia bacterium]HAC79039.1 hypothetical protein [Deltaproteobacteria bacterium]|tara:strand:- start:113 stop:322 length:210 start_codon:yes stop_codon:yes gene_type:complete